MPLNIQSIDYVGVQPNGCIPPPDPDYREPLSPSQINGFLSCPASWYYRKQIGLPDKPTAALVIGSATHAGIAYALQRAIEGYPTDAPSAAGFAADEATVLLNDAQLHSERAKIEDTTARLVTVWHEAQYQTSNAARINVKASGKIAGIKVRGEADMIRKDDLIVDYKTASRKPNGISPAHQLQLGIYASLFAAKNAAVVTLVKTKVAQCCVETCKIDAGIKLQAERLVSIAAEGMASGLYWPNRQSLYCSRRGCSFWRECESEYGGTVPGEAEA